MAAVRVTDQSKFTPIDLILNENKRGEVVIVFPGAGNPWLVKPYDLLVGLLEASPSFTKELGDSVREMIIEYMKLNVGHEDLVE